MIIIPGSKNTIGDLKFIKENGIADTIKSLAKNETMVIGICGGYQMLGKEISDPEEMQSLKLAQIGGLDLIDTTNYFYAAKEYLSDQSQVTW